jgi:transposase
MHIKRRTTQRIIEAAHALTEKDHEPEDNDALLRLLIQRLERMAALIDDLDDHIEQMDQRIIGEAMQRITGAGVIGLIAKSEALSSALKRFAASLRNNELRRKLPKEAVDD